MQIAQELAGYSLGEADLLRRAMGKKIRAEMDKQRSRFVDGAVERGLGKPQANAIFDLLAKFADYGFNKSHAAAYALVAYQTAFMKAHYPVEFIAASMTYDMSNTDKLNDFRQEAMRMGIDVVAPSVRTSFRDFEVDGNKIFYALAAIKGVGEAAVEHIVAKRKEKAFDTLEDFCEQIDPRIAGKRVIESLIAAGALDEFGHSREAMMAGLERIIGMSAKARDDAESGQGDIFGTAGAPRQQLMLPQAEPWLPAEKLQKEFQAVGFYFSAHPLDEYAATLEKMRVQSWAEFQLGVKRGATAGRLAGTITSRQERKTRTGGKMGIIQMSDPSGQFEAVLFSEALAQYREMLETGTSVVITVAAEDRPEGINLRINSVQSLESEAARAHKSLRIFVRDPAPIEGVIPRLSKHGDSDVSFIVIRQDGGGEVEIALKERYALPSNIAPAIKAVPGVVDVQLV